MKRCLFTVFTIFLLSGSLNATHVKGGFFSYQYLGSGINDPVNNIRYKVVLTEYLICTARPQNQVSITLFNGTGQYLQNITAPLTANVNLVKFYDEPCISGDQSGCYYTVAVYEISSVELPRIASGYTFSFQLCCRIAGIQNITAPSSSSGNTFTISIPGTAVTTGAEINSSPLFPVNDTAVVFAGSSFQYSFQASDAEGDSLSYQFCDAFDYRSPAPPSPMTAWPPPYRPVNYVSPYSGPAPLGPGVRINSVNGIISGTAPTVTGEYIVCVCVSEYRNGILLGTTRKELHIRVNDYEPLSAIPYSPSVCDGLMANFTNLGFTPPGLNYLWTFGDPGSGALNNATTSAPSHTYATPGAYTVKLKVSLSSLCVDSVTTVVNVFPGFYPGFTVTGSCFSMPFRFTDTTRSDYGVVNSWSWNFGDPSTQADSSHLPNPQWTYASPGIKQASLTVSNDKGCIKTVSFPVNVQDKPSIVKAFSDTLICAPGSVKIRVTGTGVFSWTPLTNIINANTATPSVSPPVDTWYYVNMNDNGCINTDSVLIKVAPRVNLMAMADTTICLNDSVQLNAVTNGLQFQWSPAATLNDATIQNPFAKPMTASTTYQVRAIIGSCSATDDVTITTVPYPVANAGPDQNICYHHSAQLNGSQNGISFSWSPVTYLDNPGILNPVSSLPRSMIYVLTVFDNKGCPKPGRDSIVLTILPKVRAFAGRDTAVIAGQPLQFNGSGGINYQWSPSAGLSNTNIFNPIGIYGTGTDSVRYKLIVTDMAGCADSSFMTVKVFKTKPTVFVPTGFTPNNDGLNDILRPVKVGIQQIKYFQVFNRWGQLVFSSTAERTGWDGRINGRLQDSGTYVWMVSAVDYSGNPVFGKGTVTLIK